MGDAAEDAIQQGIDDWMSGEYDDDDLYYLGRASKTCRHCGAIDLEWGKSCGKWRLFDSAGRLHVCSAKKVFGSPK